MIIMDWDNPMIIVDISDNNSVTKHLNKRKANAYAKLNKLIACGFTNYLINPQIIRTIIKPYDYNNNNI